MLIIKFRWDENLYSLPQHPVGEIIVDDIETAIKEMARMVSTQEILIHRNCCYSPYTSIVLYENNRKLASYRYKYKRGINPQNNNSFRKEVKGDDNIVREIEKQSESRVLLFAR